MSSTTLTPSNRAAEKFRSSEKKMPHAQVGGIVLIGSFTMLFGTMLLSYLLIRERLGVWPPIGIEPLDKQVTTLSTMVLLASSIYIHFGIKDFREGNFARFTRRWGLGTWLGLAFLALQCLFVAQFYQQGMRAGDGMFQSITYVIIIFHAIHVLGAWGWMLWVHVQSLGEKYTNPKAQGPVLASWFWHFLDVIWVLTYLLLVWY